MKSLLQPLTVFENLFKKSGICTIVGFIAGAIAGFFLLLLFLAYGGADPNLSFGQLIQVVLLLTLFDVIALLFVLIGLCRYTLTSIFLPTLINCLLTCFITTLLANGFNLWLWSIIVGMLTGLVIGRLLCILSCRIQGDSGYVVH